MTRHTLFLLTALLSLSLPVLAPSLPALAQDTPAQEKAKAPAKSAGEMPLNARNMESWMISENGLVLRLTQDGQKALHALIGKRSGRSVDFYVGPTRIASINVGDALRSETLRVFLNPDERDGVYRMLREQSVCADRRSCYFERGTLRAG